MEKEPKIDLNIKRFCEFIKESQNSINDFNLDDRFPWTEEIGYLIDDIEKKVESLKDEYNYNLHGRSDGFEFDIKTRSWPDREELSKKYKVPEGEIDNLWDQFLADNLEMSAEDIIHGSGYFDGWYQEGRSGGWLVLKHKSDIIDDLDAVIKEKIDDLNYLSDRIDDEEVEKWKKFKEEAGAGLRLLKRFDIHEDFEDILEVEEESKKTIEGLKEVMKEVESLESELINVEKRISGFWDNIDDNFEAEVKFRSEEMN